MQSFLRALKIQRWDDHRYYHHSRINQSLHLLSALSFLAAYAAIFKNPAASALIAWLVLVAELLPVVILVAWAFQRFDPSTQTPA